MKYHRGCSANYGRRRGAANNWWLRSPNTSNTTNFSNVNLEGNHNNNNASNTNGVAFGFCRRQQRQLDCRFQRSDKVVPHANEIRVYYRRRTTPSYYGKLTSRYSRSDASCMALQWYQQGFMAGTVGNQYTNSRNAKLYGMSFCYEGK